MKPPMFQAPGVDKVVMMDKVLALVVLTFHWAETDNKNT